MAKKDKSSGPKGVLSLAGFIVDKRKAMLLLFIIAVAFCVSMVSKVSVNNDLSTYLDEETETRRGLKVMEDEFLTYLQSRIMISNISYDEASKIAEDLRGMDKVVMVTFDDSPEHYKDSSALISIQFSGDEYDPEVIDALSKIKEELSDLDTCIDSGMMVPPDFTENLMKEMGLILLVAVAIIVAALIFTSESFAEIIVFFIVFSVAAILNMGTNFIFGSISFVTNSVAIILQLALAVDYAIILCHRYSDERRTMDATHAATVSLSKAIIEISSSSLTTVAGLAALTTMQFKIGLDMGLVLMKGIICSLLTVFLLMPGLLIMFDKLMQKSKHKNFVPNISGWGRFVLKTRKIMPPVFLVVIIVSFFFSLKCDYGYTMGEIDTNHPSKDRLAVEKINDTFGKSTLIAVVVPSGSYEKEGKVLDEISAIPEVSSSLGLANIPVDDVHVLTDELNPRQFSELADVDIELCRMLYRAYGYSVGEYGAILGDVDEYTAPIVQVFKFLREQVDEGVVNLGEEELSKIRNLGSLLDIALVQLEGDEHSRMIFMADLPTEGEDTENFLANVRSIAAKYYGDDPNDVILVGNAPLAMDLKDSFKVDNIRISVLTALFVMLILLVSFKSVGLPFLLILTIQGSIFINFAIPTFTKTNVFFVTYLIVSAIQMGATIDYAIVITNRYLTLKKTMSREDAVVETLNSGFATIMTSGMILACAGIVIGEMSTEPTIGTIGLALGRGTIISIILVMTVLPQLLYLGDKLIEKTAITLGGHLRHQKSGRLAMDGYLNGEVNGHITGHFKGTIIGDVDASVQGRLKEPHKQENGEKEDEENEN